MLKELTKATGGSYLNLKAKNYTKDSLDNLLKPIQYSVLQRSLDNVGYQEKIVKNNPILDETNKVTSFEEENTINKPSQNEIDKTNSIVGKVVELFKNNSSAISIISEQLKIISNDVKDIKSKNEYPEIEELSDTIIENADLNEAIRTKSEIFLFQKLQEKYGDRVKWLNSTGESGSNHDFEVLDNLDNTVEYYIECKASMYSDKVFYLTKNEWDFFLKNSKNYQIYFIGNTLRFPEITKIDNLMDWILKGKIVPYSTKNIKLKAERVVFTILE